MSPQDLEVHLVVDNYATHKHLRVKHRPALHPRFHVHLTPTYASWLNQIEIWFNISTQQAIRRGTFRSLKDLAAKIDHFVHNHNAQAQPIIWPATPDSILAKIKRLCKYISEIRHKYVKTGRFYWMSRSWSRPCPWSYSASGPIEPNAPTGRIGENAEHEQHLRISYRVLRILQTKGFS